MHGLPPCMEQIFKSRKAQNQFKKCLLQAPKIKHALKQEVQDELMDRVPYYMILYESGNHLPF